MHAHLTGHGGSTFDLRTDGAGGMTQGGVNRPGSAQPYGSHSHSYSAAVSIYSQRLSRPRSASSSGANRPGRQCQYVTVIFNIGIIGIIV